MRVVESRLQLAELGSKANENGVVSDVASPEIAHKVHMKPLKPAVPCALALALIFKQLWHLDICTLHATPLSEHGSCLCRHARGLSASAEAMITVSKLASWAG